MTLPICNHLLLNESDGVLNITLNRPKVRNAMNKVMVEEITAVIDAIRERNDIRVLTIRGAEGNFCAGGDIKDMSNAHKLATSTDEDPFFDLNRAFGRMITLVNETPQVVIMLLEGAVFGGGFGLACISDIAIADHKCSFGLPETSLGLPPAQIAPFVVTRVGLTQARRLMLTGARFNGEEAKALGLVHFAISTQEEMDELLAQQLKQIKRCAPKANRVTKNLILNVGLIEDEILLDQAAKAFSLAVNGEEGQEGTKAFKEKRSAYWVQ